MYMYVDRKWMRFPIKWVTARDFKIMMHFCNEDLFLSDSDKMPDYAAFTALRKMANPLVGIKHDTSLIIIFVHIHWTYTYRYFVLFV